MSTIPGGPEDVASPATASPAPDPATKKSRRGKIIAVLAAVGAVAAVLVGASIGRMTAVQQDVQSVAAPAPTTVTAKATKTVTSTPVPVTVTAEPSTVTALPVTVTET